MEIISTLHGIDRAFVKDHLKSLSIEDRYMRFFSALGNNAIDNYVDKLDFQDGRAFGVFNEAHLIAFVHIASLGNNTAELGISIDAAHRGNGLARKLLERVVNYCKASGIKVLYMSCLRQNSKMQHLAKSSGLKVVIDEDEAKAEMLFAENPFDRSAAAMREAMFDQISIFDAAMRNNARLVSDMLGVAA